MKSLIRCLVLTFVSCSLQAAELMDDPQNGLRLPPGFRITQVANSTLATDIQAMTFNAAGQLVVSGPGYIRTLVDTNQDFVADYAVLFAPTQTGAMGLCFDGSVLYATADQAVLRFRDDDNNNQADGPGQKLFPISMGEHGGHAIRKGPDGWFYMVAGNDTKFSKEHVTWAQTPIRNPEAGGFLRFSGDGKSCEVIAQGFRNPYDFDFSWTGELFTFDSDSERDFLLPWYKPTRFYHVSHGGHHGWRLSGFQRSWARPDYYEDTVESLALMGRGSPTGMTAYRHERFPVRYRQGFFAADWTFGKIFFFSPVSEGSSFRMVPEVFLEPVGTHGFAPTDLAVGPDGALYVSIGGRRTRGGVYRIHFAATDVAGGLLAGIRIPTATSLLQDILQAPQPLDAWSRQLFETPIRNAGRAVFSAAMLNEQMDPVLRVRAIEIITEHFNGLMPEEVSGLAKSAAVPVRARTAWSLGRVFTSGSAPGLRVLAEDPHQFVRKCSLDALADRLNQMDSSTLVSTVLSGLDHDDKRVRQAAVRVAARMPDDAWGKLHVQVARSSPRVRLSAMFALTSRHPGPSVQLSAVNTAANLLMTLRNTEVRRNALRLIMAGLSDNRLNEPSKDVYTGYELALDLNDFDGLQSNVAGGISRLFPTGDAIFDSEAARLLAMLDSSDPTLPAKILKQISATSSPVSDFHYLVVLSRLTAARTAPVTRSTADALLGLDRKLEGRQNGLKQRWNVRFTEMAAALLIHDPALVAEILAHSQFVRPNHAELALIFPEEAKVSAARLFLKAADDRPSFEWSSPLLELFHPLPLAMTKPLVRERWNNIALRDDIAFFLSREPEPVDRMKFVAGLQSPRSAVIQGCLKALAILPVDQRPATLTALANLLRRLTHQSDGSDLRKHCLNLLSLYSGKTLQVAETSKDPAVLRTLYLPVFQTLEASFPELIPATPEEAQQVRQWAAMIKTIRWEGGNAQQGAALFAARGCAGCHEGARSIGPDLRGTAQRFSPIDLFDAIAFPNRDVSPAYQATRVVTKGGEAHEGIVVFEAADGILLQTDLNTTLRLANSDVASRDLKQSSLMPTGLLDGLGAQDLRDLYAYLRSLSSPTAAAGSSNVR